MRPVANAQWISSGYIVAFAAALPHTRSGKIMRRLLRARELGLPEGDTSALESGAS